MATTKEAQTEDDKAETEGEEGKPAPAKRKLSLKLILMAVGGLVAIGGIAGNGIEFR